MAVAHALSHLGDRQPANAPGQHATVCTDCVSHAPLLFIGGAAAVAFFIAFQGVFRLHQRAVSAPRTVSTFRAFRSRAPPR